MTKRRKNTEGVALVFATLAMVIVLGALAAVILHVQSSKRSTDGAVALATLDEVCKAGIDIGVQRVWNQYVTTNGNTTGNLASYMVFLNGLCANNEDMNGNGVEDDTECDYDGDGSFEVNEPMNLIAPDEPYQLEGGGEIVRLTLSRTDDVTGSTMTLRATGRYGQSVRTAVQTIRVGGELFQGFEFGIMANNINCILCHLDGENLDLSRNTNAAMYGTFDRIKVAALESLMIRTSEDIDTQVAGTIYTRGQVYNQSNSALSAAQIASSTLDSYSFSSTNGRLTQNASTGALSKVDMANAGSGANGLNQFANLYMNYPSDESLMTDGTVPNKFPAPFPDENNDRQVNEDEFERIVNSSNGSVVFELDPSQVSGSVKAGVAYGVPTGTSYAGTALPSASNGALNDLEDGSYNGNLILIGTEDDPIVINEKVAVDGDLVIKGDVKGWGQLLVRGNVYVVGDVTYQDGAGKFGEAADGTKNGMALIAGGSIMMGDFLTIRGKNHSNRNTDKYPDGYAKYGSSTNSDNGFIDYRTANKNVQLVGKGSPLPANQTSGVGYFDTGVVDAGAAQGTNVQFSFATSELMLFNKLEYSKKQADPSYVPRYYRLRPTAPVYRWTGNDEHAVKYNDAGVTVMGSTAGAVIHDLTPKDFWLSESALRNFWYADEMSRPSSGRQFQFDGLLYSNNSIFGITPSSGRHKSNTKGLISIRGSVVSADLGMIAPSGFRLLYDRRVADLMRVEDTTRVQFARLVYTNEIVTEDDKSDAGLDY